MRGNRSGAARRWAAKDAKRRWRGLVVLGLLAGIVAGATAATIVGARESTASLDQLRVTTNAPDAVVFASQAGVAFPDWSALRAAPEVQDLAVWDLVWGSVEGEEEQATLFASRDGAFGRDITRPVITEGRMWDPDAPDELVVTPAVAVDYPIGSTIEFQPFAVDQPTEDGAPAGPRIALHVVGVGTTVNRFLLTEQAFISPGFVATYGDQILLAENADVRLRDGARDVPALQRAVNDSVAPGTPVLDLHNAARRVETTTTVEATTLYLLAGVIAVAGALLVAQAAARSAGSIADDASSLRSMGMTRGDIRTSGVLAHAPAAAITAVTAIAVAVALSSRFPVGMAGQLSPDRTTHLSAVVVLPIAVLAGLLVLLAPVWFVHVALTRRARAGAGSRLALLARRNASVTVGLGTTMALDRGGARPRLAVRPAIVGAVLGLLGMTAAFTLAAGVDDALDHPERAGVTWQAFVAPLPSDFGPTSIAPDAVDRVTDAAPDGSGVSEVDRILVAANGVGVPTFALRPHDTDDSRAVTLGLLSGRAPTAPAEVAIGPKTAADLGVEVGDTITLGDAQLPAQIVGTALFPPDVHAEFDEGLWITADTFDQVIPPADPERPFEGPERGLLLTFPSGTDAAATIDQLSATLADGVQVVAPPDLPVELTNLHHVRALPLALAALLALIAVAALSYVLVAATRRRQREIGVWRALGLDRRSTRGTVHVQATVIAAVGLVVGVPLGLVLGRAAWSHIAGLVPLRSVPPTPVVALVVVVPVTLVVVNALATWPARRAAARRPAEALRAE